MKNKTNDFTWKPKRVQNIYDSLGVDRYSRVEDIKDVYLQKAREWKTLAESGDVSALEKFARISEFNLLSNPHKKAQYDVDLAMSDPTVKAYLADNPFHNTMYKMILGKKRFDRNSLADISLILAGKPRPKNIDINNNVYLLFSPGRITLIHKSE